MDIESKKYSESEKKLWVERYQQVNNFHKVALEFDVAPMTVRRAVIKAGIKRNISPRYSDVEKNIWITLLKSGKSVGQISRSRNVSPNAIKSFLLKSGYQTKTNRRYLKQEKEEWVKRYLEYGNIHQVANEFNVPLSTVHLHLTSEGIDTSHQRKYDEKAIQDWIELYKDLKSTHKVAEKLNVPQHTVWFRLKEKGAIEIEDTVAEKWGAEINRLHQDKSMTLEEIAEHLRIPISTVYKHIRNFGKKRDFRTTHMLRLSEEHHFFDNIDSEEKAYWLGFLVADGHIHPNGIKLSLSRVDRTHLEKFADLFSIHITDYERKTSKGNISKMARADFNSVFISEVLHSKFVGQKKAHDPELYKVFKFIPKEQLRHFIRGVFDGDGYLSVFYDRKWKRRTLGFTANKIFIEHLRDKLVALLKVRSNKVFSVKISPFAAIVNWSAKKDVCSILQWMYNDSTIVLERKYKKAKEVIEDICIL